MNKANTKQTEERIKRIAKQLFDLKPRINWKDREDAGRALRRSTNTVNAYLNNKVADEVTGLELLKFLKERIQERERALNL